MLKDLAGKTYEEQLKPLGLFSPKRKLMEGLMAV